MHLVCELAKASDKSFYHRILRIFLLLMEDKYVTQVHTVKRHSYLKRPVDSRRTDGLSSYWRGIWFTILPLYHHHLPPFLFPPSLAMASPYAFATLLTSDQYLPGALTLVAALRDVHPSPAIPPEVDFQTVCLVTPETLDVSTIKILRKTFDVVIGVELIAQKDERGLALLGRSPKLQIPD